MLEPRKSLLADKMASCRCFWRSWGALGSFLERFFHLILPTSLLRRFFIDFGSQNRAKIGENSAFFAVFSFSKRLQDAAHYLDMFFVFFSYDFYAFLS